MQNPIEALERDIRSKQSEVYEATVILDALQRLMDAAGVSEHWWEPEPRGIDADFANIVVALGFDTAFSRKGIATGAQAMVARYFNEDDE